MPAPGYKHSAETKAKIGRYSRRMWARRKELGLVALADVRRLEETNTCAPSVRPFLAVARDGYLDLLEDQGGAEHVSAARKKLLDSEARLHLVELVLGMRIAQEPGDLDAMARLTAIVNARRSLLVSLGLERRAREIEPEWTESRVHAAEDAAGVARGTFSGSAPAPPHDRAPTGSAGEENQQ
ncbi:MAG: hypothetical protein WEF50_11190 [Myxococcota bacterium]